MPEQALLVIIVSNSYWQVWLTNEANGALSARSDH